MIVYISEGFTLTVSSEWQLLALPFTAANEYDGEKETYNCEGKLSSLDIFYWFQESCPTEVDWHLCSFFSLKKRKRYACHEGQVPLIFDSQPAYVAMSVF